MGEEVRKYKPKVVWARLNTSGKSEEEYRKQGFSKSSIAHIKKSDEYWDGLEVQLSLWSYDDHAKWHLWSWKEEDDERIMYALYEAEQCRPFTPYKNNFAEFERDWKSGEYDPGCVYTFPLDAATVTEVLQEEQESYYPRRKMRRQVEGAGERGRTQRQRTSAAGNEVCGKTEKSAGRDHKKNSKGEHIAEKKSKKRKKGKKKW